MERFDIALLDAFKGINMGAVAGAEHVSTKVGGLMRP